jgi:hypothetical protein
MRYPGNQQRPLAHKLLISSAGRLKQDAYKGFVDIIYKGE